MLRDELIPCVSSNCIDPERTDAKRRTNRLPVNAINLIEMDAPHGPILRLAKPTVVSYTCPAEDALATRHGHSILSRAMPCRVPRCTRDIALERMRILSTRQEACQTKAKRADARGDWNPGRRDRRA